MPFRFITELFGFVASIVTIVTAIVSCIRFFVNKKKSRSVGQQSENVSPKGK